MKVVVLAAGRSKRAKPIEDKNFLRFCGKYLIEHQLQSIKNAGFADIILIGGVHNLEKLKKIAIPFDAKVVEQKNLDEGMAGAVLTAEKEINNEACLIVSGNDIVDESAYKLMARASEGSADSYLLAYKVDKYFPGGYLELKGTKIDGIIEKPPEGNEPSDYINLVLHVHKSPQILFKKLKNISTDNDDRYELALNEIMEEKNVEAVFYNGFWQALKFPHHVLDLAKYFLSKLGRNLSPEAEISSNAVIKGNVVIESGAKIFDHAVINGPAYIGKNSIVANNALVRESIVGENSVIGFSTELARSYVGDDSWFHSNYVGDSVIGNNCSFGAGAVLANLRLDEKEIAQSGKTKLGVFFGNNARVGVNTSIMPGIKIGSNTMISSGLIITQDIESEKFVTGKTELKIEDNRATLDPNLRSVMMHSLTENKPHL